MATSGLLVKNAAVTLVNGVYHDYLSDDNGPRWLSSDKLCLMHFTKESVFTKVDIAGDAYFTEEMSLQRYYTYNTVTRVHTPIQMRVSDTLTIDDQIGNNDKQLVAESLEAEPRLLTPSEIALGVSGRRVYWLKDIAPTYDESIPPTQIYIGPTQLDTVHTLETRIRETTVTGSVTLKIQFLNLASGTNGYIKINDGNAIYATNGSIQTTASYGDPFVIGTVASNRLTQLGEGTVEFALDRVVSYKFDIIESSLTNDHTYDQETYHAALYYSEPIYELCTSTNMNHWSITRVQVDELGIQMQDSLYYAFTESPETTPYSGLPWVCIESGDGTLDPNLKVEYWDESSVQSETTTSIDSDGAVRTTTTFVNIITGETYTDTQVVREKIVSVPQDVTRYDYINLAIGKIYRFRFVSEFAKLGWIPGDKTQPLNAGVYKVDEIMSYYDMVTGRIDLFVNLYEPCGVSKAVFDDDKKRLADTVIYRLVDPNDASIIYFMPQIFIEGQPDASVLRYNKLLLMIDLGIQPNSETVNRLVSDQHNTSHPAVKALNDIDGMGDVLKQVLEKEYGLIPTDTNPLLEFSVYGHEWLTDESFKSILTERESVKTHSAVDLNTLFNCNASNRWYLQNQQLTARLQNQDALIRRLLANRTGN